MATTSRHHLLDLQSLEHQDLLDILRHAQRYADDIEAKRKIKSSQSGKIALNLFYEPSTRSQYSFVIAEERLGMTVLNPAMHNLSDKKGESLIDTLHAFEAMGVDLVVLRHQDNHTPHFIAGELNQSTHIINAGDGKNAHPSQALIDLLTIQQVKPDFKQLSVAIVGDIVHSRVANSLITGLTKIGTHDIRLIGPPEFLPHSTHELYNQHPVYTDLHEGLTDADVIVGLRIQKERIEQQNMPSTEAYFKEYGLDTLAVAKASPDVMIMHPGPINRGTEIESLVADSKQSYILNQVKNGIPMRMAIIDILLGK